MKKNLLTIIFTLCYFLSAHSQLVVDNQGRVGIGYDGNTFSVLSIGGTGGTGTSLYIKNDKSYGININSNPTDSLPTYGIIVNSQMSLANNYGITGRAYSSSRSTNTAIGVVGQGGNATNSVGVFGGSYTSRPANFAGVYGTTSTSTTPNFRYAGKYAGYFYGNVRVTDTIFARKHLSPTGAAITSPTATTLGVDEESRVVDGLRQVRALHFYNKVDRNIDDESELSHLDNINYGLDAEDLMAVYPELVHKDQQGNYSIDYLELIPLLVKSINELSSEIATLKGEERKQSKGTTTGIEDEGMDIVSMSQNNPNPFSQSSVITLTIPASVKEAAIFVYNLNGSQVAKIPVAERGETNITVHANELSAGMFIYSLVADGKVCATRKMMVTE